MGYNCPQCRFLCADIAGSPADGDCHDLLDQYAQGDVAFESFCEQLGEEFDADCENLVVDIQPAGAGGE